MALFHMRAQVISRATGRSVVAAAAYRAGEALRATSTGQLHDYRRKEHVEHREIIAPADAPLWMRDRAALWNAVEAAEKRRDAQLAREIHIALPRELDAAQRLALVKMFIRAEFTSRGMIADLAVHTPAAGDGGEQPHAHIILTMRVLTGDGFGPKARDWNAAGLYEAWRERWAVLANRALDRAGRSERIDHRNFADRGIDREPEPKLGAAATRREREAGLFIRTDAQVAAVTERGKLWHEVRERNQKRTRLEALRDRIDVMIKGTFAALRERLVSITSRFERAAALLPLPSERPAPLQPARSDQARPVSPQPPIVDRQTLFGRNPSGPTQGPPDMATLLGRGGVTRGTSNATDAPDRHGKDGSHRDERERDAGR